jgi:cysteinyl-tRNA synthetase
MLRLFNTLSGTVEAFRPSGETVKMFTCGPTVYARVHLGHGKSYMASDLVKRMLVRQGYAVRHVVNYTDVSDETARKSSAKGLTEIQLAERCERAFERDMELMNVLPPDVRPKVSVHIPEILAAAESLVATGRAYVTADGVYFRARKEEYGPLLGHPLGDSLVPGSPDGAGGKESTLDFAIWEPSPPGRLSWESPWGRGRPGWHIQDFAFIQKHLGAPIDIYMGGVDLIFPHHESEILISKAMSGEQISRFWLHNDHVVFEGRKLSKSKGVRIELADLYKRHGGEAVRFFLLQDHYRAQTRFSDEGMESAASRLETVRDAWLSVAAADAAVGGETRVREVDELVRRIGDRMEDDLRSDMAIVELEKLARLTVAGVRSWTTGQTAGVRRGWAEVSRMLGILADYPESLRESRSADDECDC